MVDNCLVISGQVCRAVKRSVSPAGITHTDFVLEHSSVQQEAGLNRQAYCRIQVVTTLNLVNLSNLNLGDAVKVSGFLNRHENKNGLARLVLHADNIERLN